MVTYPIDRVPGDTPIRVADLRAGMVLRSYSGLEDTATVERVEDHGRGQWTHTVTIHYVGGMRSAYVPADDTRELATGGPRTPQGETPAPAPAPAPRPVPGDEIHFQEGPGYVVSVEGETVTYTDGVCQEGTLPLRDLRTPDADIDPAGVMGFYALPVGFWQGDRVGIVCPLCAQDDPATWSTSEPVYRPAIGEGELCAALGVFNSPECHALETLPVRLLQESALDVWADVLRSYPDETVESAVEHVRNTLRLPEDTPVMGAYPLEDDGTPLAAAYRAILAATPAEIRTALNAGDEEEEETGPGAFIFTDVDGDPYTLEINADPGARTAIVRVGDPREDTFHAMRVDLAALRDALNRF